MLADWLAAGADPAKMTLEEVRRQQNLLAVREEQAAARLENLLEEREELFRRGAKSRSAALRRVLARRHGRIDARVRNSERELLRTGRELAGFAAIRRLLKDNVTLTAPGDCTPLLTLLDDASVSEEEFADALSAALRGHKGVPEPSTAAVATATSPLLDLWDKLDRGEIATVEEAQRRFEKR
jgi:hypothetical protein